MATGERPLSSGKLKWSEERLERRIGSVETQLGINESFLYPRRYMAQLAFRNAWESPAMYKAIRAVDAPVDETTLALLSEPKKRVAKRQWSKDRQALRLDAARYISVEHVLSARDQAEAEIAEANANEDARNGFVSFRDEHRGLLNTLAQGAMAMQVADFDREKKDDLLQNYVSNAQTILRPSLFLDHEKPATTELKALDNMIHLSLMSKIYRLGDTTLRSIRLAQQDMSPAQRQAVIASVEQGRDELPTEEIDIIQLAAVA